MRLGIWSIMLISICIGKDLKYKVADPNLPRINQVSSGDIQNDAQNTSLLRDDTTTIWLDDAEGDVAGWTMEEGWQITTESYNSPTHSFHIPNSYYDVTRSLTSPAISLPQLGSETEILKMNFSLFVDLPDFDGAGDNYLEDYYQIFIANMSGGPVYFNQTTELAYDGSSWWCGDPSIGGYDNGWVQVLETPTITVPAGGNLSAMMKWGLENFSGAAVTGTCTDGWDAANVRISNDGGSTWRLLNGSDPYDFYYGFGWIYNDTEYDCGGSMEQVSAGWGGVEDWHEVNFDLSEYEDQDVIIQFAFGSDPSYSTVDQPTDNTLTGFRVDNITITDEFGDVVFLDNADDETSMIPKNAFEYDWVQYFYDYGDLDRPGSLGWQEYLPGDPFNGNSQLDISSYAGNDIKVRFVARLDENDDGGVGQGLYIDDVHVWKVSVNNLPPPTNLTSVVNDGSVVLDWDGPPDQQFDNEEIRHHDNSAENAYFWGIPNEIRFGSVFTAPFGTEAYTVHSVMFAAEENENGGEIQTVVEGYNVSPTGIPDTQPIYTENAVLTSGNLSVVDLPDWEFGGSFLIAFVADSNVSMYVDEGATTFNSYFKSSDFGSEDWYELVADGGGSGEWIISPTVSTTGEVMAPVYNVYRSVAGGGYNPTFNGMGISTTSYTDNFVQLGIEYCYQVEAVYDGEPSAIAGPTCQLPEAQTIVMMMHDDGTAETSASVAPTDTLAVKFTPTAYPVNLYKISYHMVGSGFGLGFAAIWDDDGPNGMPGSSLMNNSPTQFVGGDWYPISVNSNNIQITEGSFYVGMIAGPQTPPIGLDLNSSSANSFIDLGNGLEPMSSQLGSEGAIMIRVEVDTVNAVLGVGDDIDAGVPVSFALQQNYPNPFNPYTSISFSLASDGFTQISLFDVSGRQVQKLVSEKLRVGNHTLNFNASDLPSGMYFYTINVKGENGVTNFSQTKKMVLMK